MGGDFGSYVNLTDSDREALRELRNRPPPPDTPSDLVRGKLLETMGQSGVDLKRWQHDLLTTNAAAPLPRITAFSRSKGSPLDPLDSIMEKSLMRADETKPEMSVDQLAALEQRSNRLSSRELSLLQTKLDKLRRSRFSKKVSGLRHRKNELTKQEEHMFVAACRALCIVCLRLTKILVIHPIRRRAS